MPRLVPPLALLMCFAAVHASAADLDWSRIDTAFGKSGATQPSGVHRWGLPRSDLKVTVDDVVLKPTLALGGWVAFQPMGDGVMLMGDLVLTGDEVSPVMKRLIEGGVDISAVHNHLLRTTPAVYYMHVGGHGDPIKLAESLHAGLSLSHLPWTAPPASPAAAIELDTAALDATLGARGAVNGGVLQYSLPRAETITESGMPVPPSLGTAIAINFQPLGGGKAATTGDFVLLGSEVNAVLKALRDSGIEVTALHSHMVNDSPHLLFMHFWAVDDALSLAKRLRAALDLTSAKRTG